MFTNSKENQANFQSKIKNKNERISHAETVNRLKTWGQMKLWLIYDMYVSSSNLWEPVYNLVCGTSGGFISLLTNSWEPEACLVLMTWRCGWTIAKLKVPSLPDSRFCCSKSPGTNVRCQETRANTFWRATEKSVTLHGTWVSLWFRLELVR